MPSAFLYLFRKRGRTIARLRNGPLRIVIAGADRETKNRAFHSLLRRVKKGVRI
jgi:hypothetical protein